MFKVCPETPVEGGSRKVLMGSGKRAWSGSPGECGMTHHIQGRALWNSSTLSFGGVLLFSVDTRRILQDPDARITLSPLPDSLSKSHLYSSNNGELITCKYIQSMVLSGFSHYGILC